MPYKDPAVARAKSAERMRKAAAAGKDYARLNSKARRKAKKQYDGPPRKPTFVAIDGEGTNQPDGDQWYTLMVARTIDGYVDPVTDSKVSHIEKYGRGGLATETCLQWLLDIGFYRNQTYVSFFFNYDVNKILHDLKYEELLALWQGNWIAWQGKQDVYYIKWIPSKFLEVAEYRGEPDEKFNPHKHLGRKITIYDTSGFFQSSFVKALEDWGVLTQEQVQSIAEMKARRNDFQAEERADIYRYCQRECYSLCVMMNRLADALWDAELYLREWHGAGAIAKYMFTKYGVKEHLETHPPEAEDAVLGAYFGGRIEMFQQGYFPEGLYDYDLQSAYPSAAITLPSLKGAIWTHRSFEQPRKPSGTGLSMSLISPTVTSHMDGLWLLSWDVTEKLKGSRSKYRIPGLIGPLPHRSGGRITFPFQGGPTWVHAEEAKTAVDIFGAENFTLHEVWSLDITTDDLPFKFLAHMARERIAAKKAGQSKHKPMKLGMNSVYGKLAQGQTDPNKVPDFLSYYHAGRITARTRAKLLRAGVSAGPALVAIATDGIFTTAPIRGLEFGDMPGSWEDATGHREPTLVVAPGILFSESGQIKKTRGFSRTSLTYGDTLGDGRDVRIAQRLVPAGSSSDREREILRDAAKRSRDGSLIPIPGLKTIWLRDNTSGSVSYLERRFVGIGGSIAAGREEIFGRWLETYRSFKFFYNGYKWYVPNSFEDAKRGRDYTDLDAYILPDDYIEREHVRFLVPYGFDEPSELYIKPHLIDDTASEELRKMIRVAEDDFDARQEQPDWADYYVDAGGIH